MRNKVALSFTDQAAVLRFIGARSKVNSIRRLQALMRVAVLLRLASPLTMTVRQIAAATGWPVTTAWRAQRRLINPDWREGRVATKERRIPGGHGWVGWEDLC